MNHREDRRQNFEKCKLLERDGKKPGRQLASISEEFEAIDSALRNELPILHDLVMKLVALLFVYLMLAQAQWLSNWKTMFQRLTGRPSIPGYADIMADFRRDFEPTKEEFENLGITGSSQSRRRKLPIQGRPTLLRPGGLGNLRGLYLEGQDENELASPKGSNKFQEVFPSAVSENADDSGPSRRNYNVLWEAASLFEFNMETTKHEAGYPYLLYQAGEVCLGPCMKTMDIRS